MPFRLASRPLALAVSLALFAGPATALEFPIDFGFGQPAEQRQAQALPTPTVPVQNQGLPQYPQPGDPLLKINELEAEIRELNGRIEELGFQMLQMQEMMRRTREDNEFRFQELEQAVGAPAPAAPAAATTEGPREGMLQPPADAASQPEGSGDAEFSQLTLPPSPAAQPETLQAPSDDVRVILDSGLTESTSQPEKQPETVAAVTPDRAAEMYKLAYDYLLAGDYALAEEAFRSYAQTYPNALDVADAKYWLGESLFAQERYADAAEVYLNAQQAHPDSDKGAEMMLKLGMTLARLDNEETACVTFAEVSRRYPEMGENVRSKLEAERTEANCS